MPKLKQDYFENLECIIHAIQGGGLVGNKKSSVWAETMSPAQLAYLMEQMLTLSGEPARILLDKLSSYCKNTLAADPVEVHAYIYHLKTLNDLANNSKITKRVEQESQVNIDGALENIREILQNDSDALYGILQIGEDGSQHKKWHQPKENAEFAEQLSHDVKFLGLSFVQENLSSKFEPLDFDIEKGKFHDLINKQASDVGEQSWRRDELGSLTHEQIQENILLGEAIPYQVEIIQSLKESAMKEVILLHQTKAEEALDNLLEQIKTQFKELQVGSEVLAQSMINKYKMNLQRTMYKPDVARKYQEYNRQSKAAAAGNPEAILWMSDLKKEQLDLFKVDLQKMKVDYVKLRHDYQKDFEGKLNFKKLIGGLHLYFKKTGAQKSGMDIFRIPGDGDCFFTSIYVAYKLKGYPDIGGINSPSDLRKLVVENIRGKMTYAADVDEIVYQACMDIGLQYNAGIIYDQLGEQIEMDNLEGYLGEDIATALQSVRAFRDSLAGAKLTYAECFNVGELTDDEYIDLMAQNGIWGGDFEASMIPDILNCKVKIHSNDQPLIERGNGLAQEIDIFHSGFHFDLLSNAQEADLQRIIEVDPALQLKVQNWQPMDMLAQTSALESRKCKLGDDKAMQEEFCKGDWIAIIEKKYIEQNTNLSRMSKESWEGYFFAMKELFQNPDKHFLAIQEKWNRGDKIGLYDFAPVYSPGTSAFSPTVPWHV
jgi:hypothetical protein